MLSELFGFLSSLDVGNKSSGNKIRLNLNKNRIRSISAYSSNSIFYFPMIVSDQATPEEVAMIQRMSEKMNASFVVACIGLMPFHRIQADDKASIEEYLKQFHQNLGFNGDISGAAAQKFLGFVDSLQESYNPDDLKEIQDFLYECWQKSIKENTDVLKLVAETVSIQDMYNIDPIDPKTRIMQEAYWANMRELDDWGFLGEATEDMFDITEEDLEDDEDLDDEDWDDEDDDIDPDDYPEDAYGDIESLLGEAALKASKRNALPDDAFGLPKDRKFPLNDQKHVRLAIQMFKHCPEKDRKQLAGNIKKAIDKFDMTVDVGEDSAAYKYLHECYMNEGTMKNLMQDLPMIFSNMTSAPMKDGNWEKLEKNYEKMIQSAKDMDRIKYIRQDLHSGVTTMTKLLDKMEQVKSGSNKYPAVAKMMKSGNTPEKLKAHIKWCKETAPKLLNARAKEIRGGKSVNESSVGEAITSIKFSLEAVTENKILSCKNLTKLATLENKLKALKNKYIKYLNRYKKKYKENKKKGSKSKLTIRFNNMTIGDPKAFMLQFGEYIKIINKRLKLVEKRRAQLHSAKGDVVMTKDWKDDKKVNESTDLGELSKMDMECVDYCITSIDQQLTAPDSQVFQLVDDEEEEELNEATIPRHGKEYDYGFKDAQSRYLGQARDASRKASRMADKLTASEQRLNRQEKLTQSARQQAADARKQAADAERKGAQLQRDNERLEKQIASQQKTRAQRVADGEPDGISASFKRGRPQSDINPYLAMDAARQEFHTFDKQVFTDMDMKKANDAIPTFAKASIGFVIDGTEETIMRDVLVGIKSYVHRAPTRELVDDVYNCIINKRKFLRFVKFITGEEKSLADLLFGFKELKNDALDGRKSGAGRWRSAFKRRRRFAKMSIPYLMKEYTPNGTVVMTMNEVEFIKQEYGIDIMTEDHIRMIMDADFLLSFVILDQANEMVYVTYDGQGYIFQNYTYSQLERSDGQTSDRALRELYRSFSR